MKRLGLILILVSLFVAVYAQTFNYPIVNRNGREYYEYTIQRGDGLYAIALKFGVKQADLYSANPNLKENIKAGDKMYIPVRHKAQQHSEPQTYHVVEKGQSLSQIARIYNVSMDTILRYNPKIRRDIIRAGDTLVISYQKNIVVQRDDSQKQTSVLPSESPETIVVGKGQTLYSISKEYNIAIHDLIDLNPDVENGLKAGMTLRLKKSAERQEEEKQEIEKQEVTVLPVAEVQEPEVKANSNALKVVYILPLSKNGKGEGMFVEFYRGALLALQKMKNENKIPRDVEVWCFDTKDNATTLDSILKTDELLMADVIVGPGYSHELAPVLRYAKIHSKMIIVPFSSKIEEIYFHDKMYQFNPTQEWWWETSLNKELSSQRIDKVIIGRCGKSNKGDQFGNYVAGVMRKRGVPVTDTYVNSENIDSVIASSASGNTVLLLANNSGIEVKRIVEKISQENFNDITLWGFGRWGAMLKKFNKTVYGSLFFYTNNQEYENEYLEIFKFKPSSVDVRYDLLGYDITMFIINKKGEYLQSDLMFKNIGGRWLNTRIYKVTWNGVSLTAE